MTTTDLLRACCPPRRSPSAERLLATVIAVSRDSRSTRDVAATLGVNPSALMSVLFRARLASIKHLLDAATVVHIAAFWERNPGARISHTATRYGFSSPQSFNRWARRITGQSASALAGTPTTTIVERYWTPALAASGDRWATLALPPRAGATA